MSAESTRRVVRVTVYCRICGDVLDTDRPACVRCTCGNAHLDTPEADDPATVDTRTEYAP